MPWFPNEGGTRPRIESGPIPLAVIKNHMKAFYIALAMSRRGKRDFRQDATRHAHAAVIVGKSWKHCDGSGDGTGRRAGKNLDEDLVRIPKSSKISAGLFGGAGRVRTAASQFCSLPDGPTTDEDPEGSKVILKQQNQ
jgi:hypothetical protein